MTKLKQLELRRFTSTNDECILRHNDLDFLKEHLKSIIDSNDYNILFEDTIENHYKHNVYRCAITTKHNKHKIYYINLEGVK